VVGRGQAVEVASVLRDHAVDDLGRALAPALPSSGEVQCTRYAPTASDRAAPRLRFDLPLELLPLVLAAGEEVTSERTVAPNPSERAEPGRSHHPAAGVAGT
jgi:hypothetical protein